MAAINWNMGLKQDGGLGTLAALANRNDANQRQAMLDRQRQEQLDRQNALYDISINKAQTEQRNLADLQSLMQQPDIPVDTMGPPSQSDLAGTERAKAEKVQNFLKERGMFEELRQLGQATDLTDRIDERKKKTTGQLQSFGMIAYMQAKSAGADELTASEAAKNAARKQAQAIGVSPEDVEDLNFQGNYAYEKQPDGSMILSILDPATGSLTIKHLAPPKPEYKDRTRIEGEKTVFEESHDGGKTWKKVSEGARHKPPAYGEGGYSNKPMPPAALKMQQEATDSLALASNLKTDLNAIKAQVESGELKLGPVSNLVGQGLNMAGMSTQNSRNLATFKATLEKLRNDSLRLNKGVQTEGDAQRAWNELFATINDPELVKQRLTEIEAINDRAANLQELSIENIRNNYKKPPLETTGFKTQPSTVGKKPAANKPIPKGGTVRYNSKGERI